MNGRTTSARFLFWMVLVVAFACPCLGSTANSGSAQLKGFAFDIVSVHASRADDDRPEHIDNPWRLGYLRAVNVNVKSLMEVAFDIPDLRMSGGPPWLQSARFSLEAKADPSVNEQLAQLPEDQAKQTKRGMIVALLADKFKLSVHTESKEMPVYAIAIAKGGPHLEGGMLNVVPQTTGAQVLRIPPGNNSLEILAYELSWRIGRPVLDRTGLLDKKAITLRWREDEEAAANSDAPSLSTALEEQLGLKLESTREPVPILLVDHAEKPTEN